MTNRKKVVLQILFIIAIILITMFGLQKACNAEYYEDYKYYKNKYIEDNIEGIRGKKR